jgi:predicted dienelactone hydrolase
VNYEVWRPPRPGTYPLILWSHFSGGDRRSASYLCEHLAQQGYIVAAMDHSDNTLPRPSAAADEREKAERMQRLIGSRVPELRSLLETMLRDEAERDGIRIDAERIGAAGHSFGGWAVLALPAAEPRVRAVVAFAPAGSSHPRPGIIPATLDFAWKHEVQTLIVTGDADVSIPLEGVREIYERVPGKKKLVVLHGVDHIHYVDNAREQHERVRAMQFPPELAYMQQEMRPFSDLREEHETHELLKQLTAAHFDAALQTSR